MKNISKEAELRYFLSNNGTPDAETRELIAQYAYRQRQSIVETLISGGDVVENIEFVNPNELVTQDIKPVDAEIDNNAVV